jgi:hypothetical protein
MDWNEFARLILTSETDEETSFSGGIEIGIDNALPVAKLKVSLGSKSRPSDKLAYADALAHQVSEHHIAQRLCDLNATLFIDDVERANEQLVGRLSDLCKLLTQGYVADNAKLVLVGSGEIYQRFYKKNPSLDERLLQVSLGAFKHKTDSWKFIAKGFEKLHLRHPGNSEFATQRVTLQSCINAVWEAADGLPKSLNRLGQEIALKAEGRKGVSFNDIISESNKMVEDHWKEYAHEFSHVIHFLEKTPIAVAIIGCFYLEGIARIHQFSNISKHITEHFPKGSPTFTYEEIDAALNKLVEMDFLVRTGKSGEIIFTKQPAAAHTLGVVMRDPARYKSMTHLTQQQALIEGAFPIQQELPFSTHEGEPSIDA